MSSPHQKANVLFCMVIFISMATLRVQGQCTPATSIETEQVGDGLAQCSGYINIDDTLTCGNIDDEAAELACYEDGRTVNANGEKRVRCSAYVGADLALIADYSYHGISNGQIGDRCDGNPGEEHCFADCKGYAMVKGSACSTDNRYATAVTCHGGISPFIGKMPNENHQGRWDPVLRTGDIDECRDGAFRACHGPHDHDCAIGPACGIHAICENTVPGHLCTCPPEYDGPGSNPYDVTIGCLDTDECARADPQCGIDECMNTIGSYVCQCAAGRDWDESDSTCEDLVCPALSPIANADWVTSGPVTYDSTTHDSAAEYKCEEGYVPSHAPEDDGRSFKMHCRPDGQYCPCQMPICERKHCQYAPLDPNAVLVITNAGTGGPGKALTGDTATYTCLKGFQAGSSSGYTRTCGNDGAWSTTTSQCTDINECAISGSCSSHSVCYNTIGSYLCRCDAGYTGDGTNEDPCTPISCGEVPSIDYAERITILSADVGTYNTEVNYRCKSGYKSSSSRDQLFGSRDIELICRADGIWEPNPLPECIPISCGDPGVIKYAERVGTSFHYKDQVSYRCSPGFRPADAVWNSNNVYNTITVTCGTTGWSGSPLCEDINECIEIVNPCGVGNHYCINEPGSYRCACDEGYRHDLDGRCIGFPARYGGGPDITTCDVYLSLNLCPNGNCVLTPEGLPSCKCQPGYEGALCLKHSRSTEDDFKANMISIVSISLSSALLLITVLTIACLCIRLPSENVFVPGPGPPPLRRRPPPVGRPIVSPWNQLGRRMPFGLPRVRTPQFSWS